MCPGANEGDSDSGILHIPQKQDIKSEAKKSDSLSQTMILNNSQNERQNEIHGNLEKKNEKSNS